MRLWRHQPDLDTDLINGRTDRVTLQTWLKGQRGRVVSASDLRSGGCGFDSRPCHVAIALIRQFTLTFPLSTNL
ncbi:hypothetical protein ElyMa_006707100 [Elysia marginata]|uniref:Uncharacterized protein n=1 Tax=Elysia marginata TaxID=1093978 RepID=A0AAV4IR44_9GAST|nr:hypothetical protein ElyMa_006707100 [Elysia marginata]